MVVKEIKLLLTLPQDKNSIITELKSLKPPAFWCLVVGNLSIDGIRLGDGDTAYFGDDNDLSINHDGSNSFITDSGSGNLLIGSDNDLWITNAGTENKARFTTNGGVNLYYDNSKKFETTGTGVTVTGTVTADGLSLGDSEYAYFVGNDLQIYHDGSNSFIKDLGTGILILDASQVQINKVGSTENCPKFFNDGAVELYYDNSKKFETTALGWYFEGR